MAINIQDDGRVIFTDGDFRRVIEPHKTRDLVGLTLSAAESQAIADKWATVPVPTPPPVDPPPSNDELYDRAMAQQKVMGAVLLYAAERAGDDITEPAVRQAAMDRAKQIHQAL